MNKNGNRPKIHENGFALDYGCQVVRKVTKTRMNGQGFFFLLLLGTVILWRSTSVFHFRFHVLNLFLLCLNSIYDKGH